MIPALARNRAWPALDHYERSAMRIGLDERASLPSGAGARAKPGCFHMPLKMRSRARRGACNPGSGIPHRDRVMSQVAAYWGYSDPVGTSEPGIIGPASRLVRSASGRIP